MRRALLLLALVSLLGAAFLLGFFLSGHSNRRAAPVPSVVDAVRADLAARYYRPIPESVLRLGSVQTMIAALADPYTEYLTRSAYLLLQRETAGRYTGIGVTLLPSAEGLLVVGTQPGPGRAAGIRVGDVIVSIGPLRAPRLGVAGALAAIAGRPGTTLELRIRRGHRVLRFSIARTSVRASAVSGRVISFGGRIYGYARVSVFRGGAAAELAAEVRSLRHAGATALVLDLRDNPGGLLDEAVAAASIFLRRGTVVTLVGAHRPREIYDVSGHPVAPRTPLVVLVNRYSASSAEILAAALHDHHRAMLFGEHTFGKAVVQSIDPLANGGALALTTARYFTPAGADISRRGVQPDVHVVNDARTPVDETVMAALASLAAAPS